jgi:hypothetical protein
MINNHISPTIIAIYLILLFVCISSAQGLNVKDTTILIDSIENVSQDSIKHQTLKEILIGEWLCPNISGPGNEKILFNTQPRILFKKNGTGSIIARITNKEYDKFKWIIQDSIITIKNTMKSNLNFLKDNKYLCILISKGNSLGLRLYFNNNKCYYTLGRQLFDYNIK